MPRPFPSLSLPCRRWLIALAMLALVAAQSLGWAHGVLHAPHGNGPASMLAGASGGDKSFGHESGSLLCQLFDLAAHADGLPFVAAPLLAGMAQETTPFAPLQAGHARPTLAVYDARGPPLLG